MIQSEHLLEYIDGQLDAESEQELFDVLSQQPELRSALRQFISIGQAVHADREAYTPPADVERSLMAGLGITARELGYASVSIGLLARLGATFGGKLWGVVDAFVLGSVLTAILLYTSSFGLASTDVRAMNGADGTGRVAAQSGSSSGSSRDGAGNLAQSSPTQGAANAGTAGTGTTDAGTASRSDGTSGTSSAFGGETSRSERSTPAVAEQRSAVSTTAASPSTSATTQERSALARSERSETRTLAAEGSSRSRAQSRSAAERSTSRDASMLESRTESTDSRSSSGTAPSNAIPNQPSGSGIDAGGSGSQSRAMAEGRRTTEGVHNSDRGTSETTPLPTISPAPVRNDVSNRAQAPRSRPSEAVLPEGVRARMPGNSLLDELSQEEQGNTIIAEVRGQIGGAVNPSRARIDAQEGRETFAVGGFWQLNEALLLGIEGGQESYDQTLRRQSGDTLQIDQRPSYIWGGASLRYYLTRSTFLGLHPFAQTTLGATSAGPVVRVRMGGELGLFGGFTANVSGEISSLIYSFDGQRLTSARWGVSLGLGYAFQY